MPTCAARCFSNLLYRVTLLLTLLLVLDTILIGASLAQVLFAPCWNKCVGEIREAREEHMEAAEFLVRDVERDYPVEDNLIGMLKVASVLNQGKLLS